MNEMTIKSPLKAIRHYCLECCGGSSNEVALCPSTNCQLYAFRKGKNPYLTRSMSDEDRQKAADRFKKYWAQRKAESPSPEMEVGT